MSRRTARTRWLDIGLGQIIVLIGWGVSIVWGYANLNSRVTAVEISVTELRKEWKETADQMISENQKIYVQISTVNAKLSTVENDCAWIKKNLK